MISSNVGPGFGSRSREAAVEEAAQWLATLSDADCNEAERRSFVEWLRSSTVNVEEFLRISALSRQLSGSRLWSGDDPRELLGQTLAGEARVVPLAVPLSQSPRARGARRFRSLMTAAIAALVLLAVASVLLLSGVIGPGTPIYSTAVGEMRSIVLPDGSVVDLNTRTRLQLRFSPQRRQIDLLEGEAIFRVARDPTRPFRVVASSTDIIALGTTFNVYAQPERTVVTVLEGRVRLTEAAGLPAAEAHNVAPPPPLELSRGEQAVVTPHRPVARVALADPDKVTSWTERRLIFEDAALAAVAQEFARYSPRLIVIEDAELAERQITGVFDATDPGALVQFLATQGDVQVAQARDGWILGRRQWEDQRGGR